ncbi:MAG: hypothetical protein JWN04_6423, partial [Myxococcaceae bacterium]|nr:hypothetical protein [Myxococcaceae bacterium]
LASHVEAATFAQDQAFRLGSDQAPIFLELDIDAGASG